MTKYVINSGNVRADKEKAKRFFAEILNGFGHAPRILFCLFALPREDWEEKFSNFTNDLPNYLSKGTRPSCKMALPSSLVNQISEADIIYIYGGDDYLLHYWLKQFDLPMIWKDKVIATSSASSNALSTYYWTCDWRECQDGLGILPIKFIPHCNSSFGDNDPRGPIDWERAKKELTDYGDKTLPVYALDEGEFIKFEV